MATPIAALFFNLIEDPFERAQTDFDPLKIFAIDQMWLFVPLQGVIKDFITTILEYPFQMGNSLSASRINYDLFPLD